MAVASFGEPFCETCKRWYDKREMGGSLYDRMGHGFTLLRLNGNKTDVAAFTRAAETRGIPLTFLDVPLEEARELYGRDLILVRPDRYIAWRGDADPDNVDAVFATVTGH